MGYVGKTRELILRDNYDYEGNDYEGNDYEGNDYEGMR